MPITAESLPQRNDKRQPRRGWRRLLRTASLVVLAWWASGFLTAYVATQPHPAPIVARKLIAGRPVTNVDVRTCDGLTVRGWLVDVPHEKRRCVVLCAGIRGNRQRMVRRAEFYAELGWSSLLVDLRGTGTSDSARISMGWNEALDLSAWHAFLRQRGYQAIGVHGQSLGAAAAAYTSVRTEAPPAWDFLVLEACYRDIEAALGARMFGLPAVLWWPVLVNAEWLLDVTAEDLDPVAALREQTAPTFLACGTLDQKVGPDATAKLFAASPAADKVRFDVPNIGHKELWWSGAGALQSAVREFLLRR